MKKILIVDDEAAIRSGIQEFAEFEGYEVAEACDGLEAIRKCQDEDFRFNHSGDHDAKNRWIFSL